jgi:hypothetical protein
MLSLQDYLPADRRTALARHENLPARPNGSAALTDISGFTALTEQVRSGIGPSVA